MVWKECTYVVAMCNCLAMFRTQSIFLLNHGLWVDCRPFYVSMFTQPHYGVQQTITCWSCRINAVYRTIYFSDVPDEILLIKKRFRCWFSFSCLLPSAASQPSKPWKRGQNSQKNVIFGHSCIVFYEVQNILFIASDFTCFKVVVRYQYKLNVDTIPIMNIQ